MNNNDYFRSIQNKFESKGFIIYCEAVGNKNYFKVRKFGKLKIEVSFNEKLDLAIPWLNKQKSLLKF